MLLIMTGVVRATVKSNRNCQYLIDSPSRVFQALMIQLGGRSVSGENLFRGLGAHLTAEEMDIPLALMSRGNTSADTTQARGPQVTANQTMNQ